MKDQLRILFLPVSSIKGMGEYSRSLAIAHALSEKCNVVDIAFALNKNAPYFSSCPFPVFALDDSPTRETGKIIQILEDYRPSLAVFDASGRVAQLKKCKSLGVSTVFIAQHGNKLAKGLRYRRLRYTDLILAVQPREFARRLTLYSRLCLKLLTKPAPVFAGPVFRFATEADFTLLAAKLDLCPGNYVLVNAGGGGNKLNAGKDQQMLASDLFLNVARRCTQKFKHIKFVVVMGPNYPKIIPAVSEAIHEGADSNGTRNLFIIGSCSEPEFNGLVQHAAAVLLSGGSSLFQAIAADVPKILAVPIATDQQERISMCRTFYDIDSVEVNENAITSAFEKILTSTRNRNIRNKVTNGLELAVNEILKLVNVAPVNE